MINELSAFTNGKERFLFPQFKYGVARGVMGLGQFEDALDSLKANQLQMRRWLTFEPELLLVQSEIIQLGAIGKTKKHAVQSAPLCEER